MIDRTGSPSPSGESTGRGPSAVSFEREYRVTLEHMEDAIHVVGPDLRIIQVNEALRRWHHELGFTEDVTGRPLCEVYPFLGQVVLDEYAQVFATGRALVTEECSRIRGREILTHTQKIPISDATGVIGVITVLRDITEARRTEDDRRRLAAILETTSDMVATSRIVDGTITYINEAGRRMLGWEADEGLGERRIASAHPAWAYRILHEQALAAVLAHGSWAGETAVLGPDGREIPTSQVIVAHRNSAGEVEYLSTIIRDITERKRIEERIQMLNVDLERRVRLRTAELEAARQELESFNYSVSHDLRAPLRGIDGFSAALLEDCHGQLSAACQGYLDRIRGAAAKMGRLIDDLLRLSRVTGQEMSVAEVDLSALVARIVADLRTGAPEREIEVVVAESVRARGDEALLRIALENLLGNAVKYTSRQPRPRIEFGVQEGVEPIYFVRDNGAGFDMAYAGRLFTPFGRLHGEDEFPGSGIGLSIVQRIIRRHGGRVWADGRENAGATFSFTLGT